MKGLPPEEFVRWRRVSSIGEGYFNLFSHQKIILKTADKKEIYVGTGAVGKGFLLQGYLSDRWILNGLAAILSRPKLLEDLFTATGQEEEGRYCVRLFEGGSWRSIFVDDRIPCGIDCKPLFCTSSDSLEHWPLLVEKAIAKYLKSYGHLALCGTRSDASLLALRWFTGGHIVRACTEDFDWKSLSTEGIYIDIMLFKYCIEYIYIYT
jgi:hypothetical protein